MGTKFSFTVCITDEATKTMPYDDMQQLVDDNMDSL